MTALIILVSALGLVSIGLVIAVVVLFAGLFQESERGDDLEKRVTALEERRNRRVDPQTTSSVPTELTNRIRSLESTIEQRVSLLENASDRLKDRADRATKSIKELRSCISPRQRKQPSGTPKSLFERISEEGPFDELDEPEEK